MAVQSLMETLGMDLFRDPKATQMTFLNWIDSVTQIDG